MDSLQMMYNMGLKNQAAMAMPAQLQSDQQMAAANLRAKQLENDQTAIMNPLNAQFKQGQIDTQNAELPGLQGQSASLVSKGQVDTATTSAQIAQRLSSLGNQVGVDGMQKMGRMGEQAALAAQALSQYPPALHKQVLPKILQAYGADPNSPLVAGIMKLPDAQVQAGLETMGRGMALAGQKYTQEAALEDKRTASSERVADIHAAASIYNTNKNADTKLAVAEKKAASMMSALTPDKRFTILNGIPEDQLTDNERMEKNRLVKFVLSARAAGAPGTTAQILANADVTTPQQNASNSADAIAPPATPPAAAPAGAGDVAGMAQAAWGKYEPDQYMYRMGPNGKLQRAPKR